MLSDVTSGHDIELVVGSAFVENLFQLMLDTGSIATNVTLGGTAATVKASEAIRRTYSAFSGTNYTVTTPSNFNLTVRDLGSFDPDHVYFSVMLLVGVGTGELTIDLWFKLRKEIDLAEEIGLIRDYIDEVPDESGAPSSYDILDLIELVGILGTTSTFDTSEGASNIPSIYQPLADQINGYLTTFQTELKDGLHEDITKFFDAQTDPLNIGSIASIAFKIFPDTNRLGVYVNLKLLDHDSGWVGSRGDLDDARDFVPAGADFAAGTSPGLAAHLIDDLMIKTVAAFNVANELMTESEAEDLLDGDHFPLDIPEELANPGMDENEDEGAALTYQVKNTLVETVSHTFTDDDDVSTTADTLKLVVVTNEALWEVLGLASENIAIYVTPIDGEEDGIMTADLGIDANLKINVFRTIVSSLNPLNVLKLAALPIVAVINLFANAEEELQPFKASDGDMNPLARLTLIPKRWDPFYTTQHGFLLEKDQCFVEDDRLAMSGNIVLSKVPEPFERVYPRDVTYSDETEESITRILYKVESESDIVTTSSFATDRETFQSETTDVENSIYSILRSDALDRVEADKLEAYVPFSPYCRIMDPRDSVSRIQYLKMLSDEEVSDIEYWLEEDWLEARAEEIVTAFEEMGFTFTEEERATAIEGFKDDLRENGELDAYLEDEMPDDRDAEIFSEGKLRLKLGPASLKSLVNVKVMELPGFESVVREGRIYYRDEADRSTEDNLLSLRNCP